MKRPVLITLMLACCLLVCTALAEQYTVSENNTQWRMEHFTSDVPQEVAVKLAQSAFADGEVVEGIYAKAYDSDGTSRTEYQALLHLRRDGADLLAGMACAVEESGLIPLSDTFLQPGDTLAFAAAPTYGGTFWSYPAVVHGEERWLFSVGDANTPGQLAFYQQLDSAGNGYSIRFNAGALEVTRLENGAYAETLWSYDELYTLDLRAEAIERAAFPTTLEAVQSWVTEHPVSVEEDDCYLMGANLRTDATTTSDSLGMLTAVPAKIIKEKEGKQVPWVQVRIGGMTGWVADNYVQHASNITARMERILYCHALNKPVPVARTLCDTSLKDTAGNTIAILPAGTVVHVLTEGTKALLVGVPADTLEARPDTQTGQVGLLSRTDVELASSPLGLKYGVVR